MLEIIQDKSVQAIYLNFPFCRYPCTYCHYVDNIDFGHYHIPNEYMDVLGQQLHDVLSRIDTKSVECIYFGGGTASLLSDEQINVIRHIFDSYHVRPPEISIEIHPQACNFDYINNTWFTRYSIGVQTLDRERAHTYRRDDYSLDDISQIIQHIRATGKQKINLDFIFEDVISLEDIAYVNEQYPNTATFYPNTKGRGEKRLQAIFTSLQVLEDNLKGYRALGKNPFIVLQEHEQATRYSEVEYVEYGNLIGIGHNSFSLVGEESYLTRYDGRLIHYKKRYDGLNRILVSLFSSIAFGVKAKAIKTWLPKLMTAQILFTVDGDKVVGEKHTMLADDDLVYLPPSEYIRFLYEVIDPSYPNYEHFFNQSIGYGDGERAILESVYNQYKISNPEVLKKKTPTVRILIEGIDGSGKDTFAKFLVDKLKERFYYAEDSRISIVGQPDSTSIYGPEVKKFVEDLVCEVPEETMRNMMTQNRLVSEEKFKAIPGILIMIRGLGTDKGTYQHVFHKDVPLGEGQMINQWDLYVVVDAEPSVADARIEARGIPRTWRESLEYLTYFREFFKSYKNPIFKEKLVIYNDTLVNLEKKATDLADKIYGTY